MVSCMGQTGFEALSTAEQYTAPILPYASSRIGAWDVQELRQSNKATWLAPHLLLHVLIDTLPHDARQSEGNRSGQSCEAGRRKDYSQR